MRSSIASPAPRTAPLKSAVYRLADRLAPNGVKRTVNGEHVRWPAAWSRHYAGEYQRPTHSFLERHVVPGSLAIDAGAHIGLFTVVMARRVGRGGHVVSVEPSHDSAAILDEVIRLNDLRETVTVCRQPLSDASRETDFFVAPYAACVGNSLVQTRPTDEVERRVTTTIDDLVGAVSLPVSCMKIDVEGAEDAVLRGARATVAAHRPALALDIHASLFADPTASLRELWNTLAEYDYRVMHESELVTEDWFMARTLPFEVHATPLT